MRKTELLILTLLTTSVLALPVEAANRFKAKGTTNNSQGGVTSARAAGVKGANGGGFARGGAVVTDGNGNATGGSAQGYSTANGSSGGRVGGFNKNGGNTQYSGAAAASGQNGNASTQGGFTRSEEGAISGGRSTNANADNGASYTGSTTYQSGQGVEYQNICVNADGVEVPCKK